jgi:glutathione S-transferase
METGHEQGMTTRDLAGGATAADPELEADVGIAQDTGDDTLLPADEDAGFQRQWEGLQAGFVDEPRRTVEQADELVAHVMQRLAEGFAEERERLEQQWGRGEDVSTEDLRVALQRYRSFFQRLLSA